MYAKAQLVKALLWPIYFPICRSSKNVSKVSQNKRLIYCEPLIPLFMLNADLFL